MLKKYFIFGLIIFTSLLFLVIGVGCDTGVEASSEHGILRVNLVSDPSDTSLIIKNNTYTITEGDSMALKVFQGKAYKDSIFAVLYKDIEAYKQEDITYNIIKRKNNEYKKYTIFESYVPPFEYHKIEIGLTSNIVRLSNFDDIKVESPNDYDVFVDLQEDFEVFENEITEINIFIKPFKSITRFKDSYRFVSEVRIVNIVYE